MKTALFPSSHSILERLEPKLAPAGTVLLTTAGGALTITGDAVDNGIVIQDDPDSAMWTISAALAGTTFVLNGVIQAAPFDIPAQTAIKGNLGDGNDIVSIQPASSPTAMLLSGGINLKMGKGDDQLLLGSIGADVLTVGAVTADMGEGNDIFDSTVHGTYLGAVKVTAGLGDDTVRFDNVVTEHVFLKGLSVDLGKGDNTFNVTADRFAVTGPFTVIDAGEAGMTPSLSFNSDVVTVDGPAAITMSGGGTGSLTFGNALTDVYQFGAGLKITGGSGTDTVVFNGAHTYAGGVTIDLKAGNNTTLINDDAFFTAASLTVKGTTGNDALMMDDNSAVVINGALSMQLGNGVNQWTTDLFSTLTAGSVSYVGGTEADTVDFNGDSFVTTGAMTLNVGAGVNGIDLLTAFDASVGTHLTLAGGAGNDTAFLQSVGEFRIGGSLKIGLGVGNNSTTSDSARLQVAGGIIYTGGAGDDAFVISDVDAVVARQVQFSGGAGENSFFLNPGTASIGSLSYAGGTGTDALLLGNTDGVTTTRLTVNGAVTANMGAGTSDVHFMDTTVHGAVNISSTSTTLLTDLFSATQSVFNTTVNINLGAGNAFAEFNDVTMRGALNLNLGAGDDTTVFDVAGGTADESHWLGLVKVNLGAGNDFIIIGTNPIVANAGNNFYRNVLVDGGLGTNTLNPVIPGSSNTFLAGATLIPTNIT